MKKLLYLFTLLIPLLFTGCVRSYYPALYQTTTIPMLYDNENNNNSSYLGADVNFSKGDYDGESLQVIRASYIFANISDYINVNFKGFGYTGNYRVNGLGNYDGDKGVFGGGAEFGLSGNLKLSSLKLGIGFTAGAAGEYGDYYHFRRKADEEGVINSEQGLMLFTLTIFPVIAYSFSESTILSMQMNLGIPGFLSPHIALNNNGFVYWLSWLPENRSDDFPGRRLAFGFMMNMNKFSF
jgi:hypothetical protein